MQDKSQLTIYREEPACLFQKMAYRCEGNMKPVHGSRAGELTYKVCDPLAFASLVTLAQAQEASVEALKEGIEGVYVLQESHRNAEVMRPPLVDARIVLLNGRIVFIAHDGSQDPKKKIAGYGVYVLEPGKFLYRYERFSMVTQTENGASVSEKLPWDGLRPYAANIDGNGIHFRATNGPQEWWFNADGLSYSDGTQMRVYRRITDILMAPRAR